MPKVSWLVQGGVGATLRSDPKGRRFCHHSEYTCPSSQIPGMRVSFIPFFKARATLMSDGVMLCSALPFPGEYRAVQGLLEGKMGPIDPKFMHTHVSAHPHSRRHMMLPRGRNSTLQEPPGRVLDSLSKFCIQASTYSAWFWWLGISLPSCRPPCLLCGSVTIPLPQSPPDPPEAFHRKQSLHLP